jgi:hypothetical protein
MKQFYTLLFSLFALTSFGQVQKGKYLTSGTFEFRNYFEGSNPYKRLQIGLTNKTGFFINNTIAVGLKTDYSWTHEKTKRFGTIQIGGSQWYEKGIYNRHDYGLGVFADKYFKLSKKLYITLGIYGQYNSFSDIEKGDFFDQNDEYVGVSYSKGIVPYHIIQIGLTNSLIYFLNKRWGINCLVSTLESTINEGRAAEFDFRTPIMNLGIQYHFPK